MDIFIVTIRRESMPNTRLFRRRRLNKKTGISYQQVGRRRKSAVFPHAVCLCICVYSIVCEVWVYIYASLHFAFRFVGCGRILLYITVNCVHCNGKTRSQITRGILLAHISNNIYTKRPFSPIYVYIVLSRTAAVVMRVNNPCKRGSKREATTTRWRSIRIISSICRGTKKYKIQSDSAII